MKITKKEPGKPKTSLGVGALLIDDRGDVPGWVLITLMTAGLVVAIWAIAGPALNNILDDSFSRVAGF